MLRGCDRLWIRVIGELSAAVRNPWPAPLAAPRGAGLAGISCGAATLISVPITVEAEALSGPWRTGSKPGPILPFMVRYALPEELSDRSPGDLPGLGATCRCSASERSARVRPGEGLPVVPREP